MDPGAGHHHLTADSTSLYYAIITLSSIGRFLNATQLGEMISTGVLMYDSFALDASGSIVLTGTFSGDIDFDNGIDTNALVSHNNSNDVFVQKLDSNKRFLWVKRFGGADHDYGGKIAVSNGSSIVIAGNYTSQIMQLDSTQNTSALYNNGNNDFYMISLTGMGVVDWAGSVGGTSIDGVHDLDIDRDQSIYITGSFSGVADFDLSNGISTLTADTANSLNSAIFIAKYKEDGSLGWANALRASGSPGSYGYTFGRGIDVSPAGKVSVIGEFAGVVDFDPDTGQVLLSSVGETDVFVMQLSDRGDHEWTASLGTSNWDFSKVLATQNNGDLYVFGSFVAGVTLQTGATNLIIDTAQTSGLLIAKLSSCSSGTFSITVSSCGNYRSPSTKYLWTKSGYYTDTLSTVNGCDSIIEIELFIDTVDTRVIKRDNVLEVVEKSAYYQWIDCKRGGMPISGATGSSFSVQQDGQYAVIVTKNGCSDTSACTFVSISTGLLDRSESFELTAYPNPTTSNIKIRLPVNFRGGSLQLINMLGQTIYHELLSENNIVNLELPDAPGQYIVVIKGEDGSIYRTKVLKQL